MRSHRATTRVLIVDSHTALRSELQRTLCECGYQVRVSTGVARTAADVREFQPDLMLLGVELAHGQAFDILREVNQIAPAPAVIGISRRGDPQQAFQLAKRGMRAYLRHPITTAVLKSAIDQVLTEQPDIVPHLRAAVGLISIRELERTMRRTMIAEALARSQGNRSGAAELLKVSRQLLQYMMRRDQNHKA